MLVLIVEPLESAHGRFEFVGTFVKDFLCDLRVLERLADKGGTEDILEGIAELAMQH